MYMRYDIIEISLNKNQAKKNPQNTFVSCCPTDPNFWCHP